MCEANSTLLLALGNPLRGDDGVGSSVIEYLQQVELPEHVTLLDGSTPGLEIVLLMQGYVRVVIIDAADMGQPPGTWAQFTPDMVRLDSRDPHLRGTLHDAGLAEALELGAALNVLPPEIIIFGIQPQSIAWQTGLSVPVMAAVPQVAGAVLRVVVDPGGCVLPPSP